MVVVRRPRRAARQGPGEREEFYMYGEQLKIVEEAEHLGVPVASKGSPKLLLDERLKKARRAIHGTISYFDHKNILNVMVKLDLWQKVYKAVILYGLNTARLSAADIKRLDSFQVKILKATLSVSRRASNAKTRILCGQPALSTEVWRRRLSEMSSILIKGTLAQRYIYLNLLISNKKSWSWKGIEKLRALMGEGGPEPVAFLRRGEKRVKEDIKVMLYAEDQRNLARDVSGEGRCFDVPTNLFQGPRPMILLDFSAESKREVRSFSQVFTGDFYRNYGIGCFVCQRPVKDNTEHLLGSGCEVVALCPEAEETWSEIKQRLETAVGAHIVTTSVVHENFRVRFLLDPTSHKLGDWRVPVEDLQLSGLDRLIRKFAHRRLMRRYRIVRLRGQLRDNTLGQQLA